MGSQIAKTQIMFTLDTNIVIYYAAGDKKVASFLSDNQNEEFYLPSMAAVEFLSYPLIDVRAKTLFRLFAGQTTIISLDYYIAELSAEIRKDYKLKLADAVIAATAISTNSILLTRNIRDFKKVKGLKIMKI